MNDCMPSQLLGIMHLHSCRVYLAGVSSSSGECRAGTRTRLLGMAGWPTSALLARQDGPYPHLAHTHTHTHSPRCGFTRSTSHIHLIPRTYTRLRALRAYHRKTHIGLFRPKSLHFCLNCAKWSLWPSQMVPKCLGSLYRPNTHMTTPQTVTDHSVHT